MQLATFPVPLCRELEVQAERPPDFRRKLGNRLEAKRTESLGAIGRE